jgi:hypothetical protein
MKSLAVYIGGALTLPARFPLAPCAHKLLYEVPRGVYWRSLARARLFLVVGTRLLSDSESSTGC